VTLPFEFVGGAPALDFVNTVSWGERDQERFNSFDDVVDWAMKAGVIKRRERGGARELRDVLKIRDMLHRVFIARANDAKPAAKDLNAFNSELAEIVLSVQWGAAALARARRRGAGAPLGIRDEVLWNAAQILTSDALIRTCANVTCGWVFIDTSRRGNRRWCDMAHCGARDKALRYYNRISGKAAGKRR